VARVDAVGALLGTPVLPSRPEGVLYFAEAGWPDDDGIGVTGVKFATYFDELDAGNRDGGCRRRNVTKISTSSGDDHPLSDIRLGERFIVDAYHALADNGYLDDTVLVITFDEWGGFYDHVPPPMVVDETNPANVMHAGDSTTPTDGQLVPNYKQLGFRVPAIVVPNLVQPGRVVHAGPFQHCSRLALIESTFGLQPLTARDKYARNLRELLLPHPVARQVAVPPAAIPTSSEVIGPVISAPSEPLLRVLLGTAEFDPGAMCAADSVQSVSPPPVNFPAHAPKSGAIPGLSGTAGMADLNRRYRGRSPARN
jgi:phospholipase C